MRINEYIKLPLILKLQVKNYRLFRGDWSYDLKKGLNFFLGANTLGKTTTVYILLYGITGLPEENRDFFMKRTEGFDANEVPIVRLMLKINNKIVDIERDLRNSKILHLSIDGEVNTGKIEEIDKIYEENIKEATGFSSLEDYRFLLEKLLIREEEGNYLLWNSKDQARVLRLLFGSDKLDVEFKRLEKKVTEYDSKWRGKKDIQAQFKKRLEATREQRKDKLRELGSMNIDELERNIKSNEVESKKLTQEKENLLEKIRGLGKKREIVSGKISVDNSEKEELESEILNLENELFESSYADPKISLAFHKLKNYAICMFCNHKLSSDISQKIVEQIKNTKCPVCKSVLPLKPRITVSTEKRKKLILELNQKRERISNLERSLESNMKNLEKVDKTLNPYWEAYSKVEKTLSKIITDIDDFQLRLADIKKGKIIKDMAVYDRDIQNLQRQMDFYEKQIEKDKEEFEKAKEQLERLSRAFEENMSELKKDLVEIFKDYSKNFFNQCELEIQHDKPKDSKIALPVFRPKVNNVLRERGDQVSKSEGIFLEYIFRMSLCQIFSNMTGNKIHLMIETSEGVFDIGIIETIADVFVKFSKENDLIVISNLGRQDFLKSLVKKSKLKDLSERMLNFLEIGRLSIIQEKNLPKYKNLISVLESISTKRGQA